MTIEQAIALAGDFAREKGYDVARYDPKATAKRHEWQVDFYARDTKARPGDFFSVLFNEQTPTAMRLVPGK